MDGTGSRVHRSMVCLAGLADSDSDHPRGSERLGCSLRFFGEARAPKSRHGLTGNFAKPNKLMNPDPQMTVAVALPHGRRQAPAPARDPELSEFSETLFGLMEELSLPYCLLAEPCRESSNSVCRLEITVLRAEPTRFPLLFGKLREKGYIPLQSVPLNANDCRYDFASRLDADAQFFSITIRETFPGGRLFITDGGTLARRQNRGNCWIACEADRFCY